MSGAVCKIEALIECLSQYLSGPISSSKDAFVVVTKWPTKGKSKTRLSKCIGPDLAIDFSLCALKDLLLYFSTLPHSKFLLFAPRSAEQRLLSLLTEIGLTNNEYHLVPMRDSNLSTSNLGDKLSGCLLDIRSAPYFIQGTTCFIGSDCVELRHHHINTADTHTHCTEKETSYIIPAEDGGFVLIDLPAMASPKVFDNVQWSTANAAESQMAAIEKCGIKAVKSDKVLADVDEMEDWLRVCGHFGIDWNGKSNSHVLNGDVHDYMRCFPKVAKSIRKAADKPCVRDCTFSNHTQ